MAQSTKNTSRFTSQTQKVEVEKYRGLTIMKGVNRYGEFYYVRETAPSFSKNHGFIPFIPLAWTLDDIKRNIDEVYEAVKENLVYWSEVSIDLLKSLYDGAGEVIDYLVDRARNESSDFIVFDGHGYYKPVHLFEDIYYYLTHVENPKWMGIKGHRLLDKIRESFVPEEVKSTVNGEDLWHVVLAVNKSGRVYVLAYVSLTVRTRDDVPTFLLIRVPKEISG